MQSSTRFWNCCFRYLLEPFIRKVYCFIIWCDTTLKLSPEIKLKECGWELDKSRSIQLILMMLRESSIAWKELILCKGYKNVPKDVVANNEILNVQNFLNLVEGKKANLNINTIKTTILVIIFWDLLLFC